MALTITKGLGDREVSGNRVKTFGTVDFDSSYPNGGEVWVVADWGLYVVDHLVLEPKNGYYFEPDLTNKKIKAFKAQSHGVINVNLTGVGNVTTGEDDLITYALPASTLSANGMGLRITAWGSTANNANTKTVKLFFGATAILTQALTASIAGSWRIVAEVFRTGVDTQDCIASLSQGATDIAHAEFTATTIDDGAAITIKCTGESSVDTNDLIQEGLMVELLVPQGTGAVGAEVMAAADLSGLTGVRWWAVGI